MDRIYLDYAATTPVDEVVVKEMQKYYLRKNGLYGNPSALHSFGQTAFKALEQARTEIAHILEVHHSEILFFSSATEVNNFVLRSVVKKYTQKEKRKPHIIISAIEHPSILETAHDIQEANEAEVTILPAMQGGYVSAHDVYAHIQDNTALVSIIYVQNEIGTIQDISEISKHIKEYKKEHKHTIYPLLHSDASQGHLCDLRPEKLGVDFLTLSSHKMYGPMGVATLYVKQSKIDIRDIVCGLTKGGDQERGFRAGTENIPAIVGFATALRISNKRKGKDVKHIRTLSDRCWIKIKKKIPGARLHGGKERSPHILNVYIPGPDRIEMRLDMQGIAVSRGSACSQRISKPSTTLSSLGYSQDQIRHSIRISIGRYTTKKEIDEAVKKIIIVSQK